MKKTLLMIAALISFDANAQDYRYVNADGSDLSELCIAALDSHKAMVALAQDFGLRDLDEETLACNGQPLRTFVLRHGKQEPALLKNYTFRKSNQTMETELCLAAVTDVSQFNSLKAEYFSDNEDLDNMIRCNKLPLSAFVRKYQRRQFTAAK